MDEYEPFVSLAVALGVGLLIGLQREQTAMAESRDKDDQHHGGIRTYPLLAISGALSMLIARQTGMWIVGVVFAAALAPLIIAYKTDVERNHDRGLTSEVASMITFLLGAMALADKVIDPATLRYKVVAAVAVSVTVLLSAKAPLHSFVRRISSDDLIAALKFLILAVIVLPLLPNKTFGPLDVLNPFAIGLMIVLIAGLGFIGYIAVRLAGPGRGAGIMGLLGGLASSTAVTLAFSGRAKRDPKLASACALAVILASTVMLVRVVIEVAAVHPPLVAWIAWPLGAALAAGIAGSIFLYFRQRRGEGAEEEVKFHNPFELAPAFKFGLLFALVLLAVKAATVHFGQRGVLIAAAIAGLTDVDSITLSMARMAEAGARYELATAGVLLGCLSNTAVKAALTVILGGWAFGRYTLPVFGMMMAAGVAAAAIVGVFSGL